MPKRNLLVSMCILSAFAGRTQTGSMKATFTPARGGKPVTIELQVPLLKYDNAHGYWFTNPHTGDRHVQYMPEPGWGDRHVNAGYVTLNEKVNDFDIYSTGGGDTNDVSLQSAAYVISPPEYVAREGDKNKPMHVHISSFSASEFSFTFSGAARGIATSNDAAWTAGTVEGSGHFFREPKYQQTGILPGCDCDPAIYATVYDEENNVRTTSACENALKNKVFNAVQKAMAPLFSQVGHSGSGVAAAGDIDISMLPGRVNINVPVKDIPWCSSDYRHNWRTGFNAQKKLYNDEDSYGLRFIKIPTNDETGVGAGDNATAMKKQAAYMDSVMKLMVAKKITAEQFNKAIKDMQSGAATGSAPPNFKRMEVEHNLSVQVIFNPDNAESMLLKMGDKDHTVVQHQVRGGSYEIFSPMSKDSDGSWVPNRLFIYLGSFEPPVRGKSGGGFDAQVVKANYPPNGNKLNIYSILVKLEGDKEMAGKAIDHIDFDALLSLISKQ